MDIDPERANGLEPPPQDKVQALQSMVDGVIAASEENIRRLVDRQDNLEELEKHSMELEEKAKVFKKLGKRLECTYCLKNVKLIVVLVVVILIIILIIVLLAAGVIPIGSSRHP